MYNLVENNDLLKVEFKNGISKEVFDKAVSELIKIYNENLYKWTFVEKFKVNFREKANIYSRGKDKLAKNAEMVFFNSEGRTCYRIDKRNGYLTAWMDWDKIDTIELWKRDSNLSKSIENEKKKKFFNRIKKQLFDEVTWSHLTEDSFNSSSRSFFYLKNLNLSSWDKQRIKEAFEEKKEVHIREYGDKRDYSIETKMGEDGVFRAWFSSEYKDCCNGGYYLLLNPEVAVHYEND